MSFVDPSTSKELILPVTPAAYTWNGPTKLETVSLDQLGEATLHGGAKMGDGSLEDVLLPAQQYPFLVPGGRVDPEGYIADLEAWGDKGAQLQWIVSDTGINLSVVIESITKGERVLPPAQTGGTDRVDLPPTNITVSGNTFGAGLDEAAVAEAIADTAVRKILAGFQG